MSSNILPAIEARAIGKHYPISGRKDNWWRPVPKTRFQALEDVSFTIRPGEVVGIVGRNGAGKSTLLKILTQITAPSEGEADLHGRVGSLLEVGTGFHPELTGRENIFLNGSILGMRRAEIRSEFDAIVAFAGVEKFLETPVKRYSSGMYVRLAFAVAAHLRSEILLIDEVLAVGDADFQKRCLGKIRDVADSGRTILFVSHHLQSVASLCSRLLVLAGGRLVHDGGVQKGIECYMSSLAKPLPGTVCDQRRPGTGELRVSSASSAQDLYECDEAKRVLFSIQNYKAFSGPFFLSIHLVDATGNIVTQCDSRLLGQWFDAEDRMDFEFKIQSPWLKPGEYRVDIYVCASGFLDQCEHACVFEVLPMLPYPGAAGNEALAHGIVFGDFEIKNLSRTEQPAAELKPTNGSSEADPDN